MRDKLKILFLPYLLALLVLVSAYSYLHWYFILDKEIFQLRESFTNFIIPATLSGIFAWLILRPKLKIIYLGNELKNNRDFYSVILWLALTIPLSISQLYLITATGELTELQTIYDIQEVPSSKYYSVKDYFLDKSEIREYLSFEVGGKNNQDFNMNMHAVVPFYETEKDHRFTEPVAWLGIHYHKRISNRLDNTEKLNALASFSAESSSELASRDLSQFRYFDRISPANLKEGYIEAINSQNSYKPNHLVLMGINEPFEARNGNTLAWTIRSSLIGTIVWLIMIVLPKIDPEELERIKAGKPDLKLREDIKDFLYFLLPREGYFSTPILMYLIIVVFAVMSISGLGFIYIDDPDLLNWGASMGSLIESGEWWRLLSNIFVHPSIVPLLFNIYGLVFVGLFLEHILGRFKFLVLFLICGFLASTVDALWYENELSAGAAQAIFGLYGFLLALLSKKLFEREISKLILSNSAFFIGLNFLFEISGNNHYAGYIIGIISGFVFGLLLSPSLEQDLEDESL